MHSDNTSNAPVMFCHDGDTIYYPTGPGRVHMIAIAALADCDGSDEDFSDSTVRGDLTELAFGIMFAGEDAGTFTTPNGAPLSWPKVRIEKNGDLTDEISIESTAEDFADCLEQWADWCDRDAARIDSLDGPAPDADAAGILARLRGIVAKPPYTLQTVAEVVAAITDGQAGVAA